MDLLTSPHRSHWIHSPFDHAHTLHPPSGQGLVTLAIHDGHWREWPMPVQDVPNRGPIIGKSAQCLYCAESVSGKPAINVAMAIGCALGRSGFL